MFVCLHLRCQGNPEKRRPGRGKKLARRKRGPPPAPPRSTPKSSVYTVYLDLTLRPCRERPRGCGAADERDEFPPPHSVSLPNLKRFPRYATVCCAGKFQWVSAADSTEFK